jgi:hypothetical protein
MARQAIVRYFDFGVAIHAPFHGHLHPGSGRRAFALSNVSMARLTFQLSQRHMTTMGEEDVIGLTIELIPGDFLVLLLKLSKFFLFRTLCNRVFMAFEAGFDLRHSGEGLGLVITMTGVACQSLVRVFLVIERDRLFGL